VRGPERLLSANVGDPAELRLRLEYRPEALLHGEADRLTIEAESAVVGELKREDRARLRVREALLEVDGLVFNPRRFLETGQLEVLDVSALRIRHLAVTEADLRDFLRGQPPGASARERRPSLGGSMRIGTSTKLFPAHRSLIRIPAW
jgi:hypothetical protein